MIRGLGAVSYVCPLWMAVLFLSFCFLRIGFVLSVSLSCTLGVFIENACLYWKLGEGGMGEIVCCNARSDPLSLGLEEQREQKNLWASYVVICQAWSVAGRGYLTKLGKASGDGSMNIHKRKLYWCSVAALGAT